MGKIAIFMGHPNTSSLGSGLADAYQEGAEKGGHEVRRINLVELDFDPILRDVANRDQDMEPDLKMAQETIIWSDHLVFVYPTWWATMPALLKGFVDRTIIPGFAYKYQKGSAFPEKLLKGRTARLITTMDAPKFYYALVYRQAGHNAMKRATLLFCGVKPVRISAFGNVRGSSPEKREKWKQKLRGFGARAV